MRSSLKRMFWVFIGQAGLVVFLVTCDERLPFWLASTIAVVALLVPFVSHVFFLDRGVRLSSWPRVLRAGCFTFTSLLLTLAGYTLVAGSTDIVLLALRR